MPRRDVDQDESAAMGAQAGLGTLEPPTTNGAAPVSEGAAAAASTGEPTKRKRTPRPHSDDPNELFGVTIRVPQALKDQLDKTAKEQDIGTPQLVIRMLADAYTYTLPEAAKKTRRTQRYATEEEKKQAQRAAQAAQRNRVKALLAAVESGQINVDIDALVAEMAAKQAAAAAEAASASANAGAEGAGENATTPEPTTTPEPALAGAS